MRSVKYENFDFTFTIQWEWDKKTSLTIYKKYAVFWFFNFLYSEGVFGFELSCFSVTRHDFWVFQFCQYDIESIFTVPYCPVPWFFLIAISFNCITVATNSLLKWHQQQIIASVQNHYHRLKVQLTQNVFVPHRNVKCFSKNAVTKQLSCSFFILLTTLKLL